MSRRSSGEVSNRFDPCISLIKADLFTFAKIFGIIEKIRYDTKSYLIQNMSNPSKHYKFNSADPRTKVLTSSMARDKSLLSLVYNVSKFFLMSRIELYHEI